LFIQTEKLTHIYMPGTPFAAEALNDINFTLAKGQVVLLIGPSGSGKSTLVQHLNGLLKPTSGRVYFDGRPVGGSKVELLKLRRRIGLVFQMPEEQFFSETVYDEIAFAPRNLGLADRELDLRVDKALARVGLEPDRFRHRHPFHLSSGQKRLIALAAVLSLEPEVLILDEPTAGLDPVGRRRLYALLADLNKKEKITLLIATHHYDEAAALADQVLVLYHGKMVMDGTRSKIFSNREALEKLGLALPPVTEIMHDLADSGLPLNKDIYNFEEARTEINKLKGSGTNES